MTSGSGTVRRGLKWWAVRLGALAAGLGVMGFLVVVSGIVPVGASSGHWAVTRWFLEFSMSRSVATHSSGVAVPPLEEPRFVLKGAGHYETGCAPCHGSPARPNPWIAQGMTPPPPYLPPAVPKWEPGELYYIVKHGVKFTGMPAWPSAHRDDEVWAVVAFLRALPDLDAGGYRQLVDGESPAAAGAARTAGAPVEVFESCGRCHGVDGLGRGGGAFPRLAGQSPTYLQESLEAYARGERHSGTMQVVAASLRQESMLDLARYYGSLEVVAAAPPTADTAPAIARGEAIALRGIPARRVPACIACHGPGTAPRDPHYPELAGQYAEYLELQLEIFKREQRGGTAYAHLMRQAAAGLGPDDVRDVSRYYESLAPARAGPGR
jgi:cytochrome c553